MSTYFIIFEELKYSYSFNEQIFKIFKINKKHLNIK